MANPSLVVSPLEPDEAPQYMRIRHESFRHDINKILYFNGEPSQKTLDRVTQDVRNGISKGILYLKCVDTSTGEMIAGARWEYIRPKDPDAKERTREEIEQDLGLGSMYEESHPEVWNTFFSMLNAAKREHRGTRPHYVLQTLATLPKHHRRGAGRLLTQWGCERADEAGVEAFLEASKMGQSLYERFGFVPIREIAIDLKKWGGQEEIKLMVRNSPALVDLMTDT